MEEDEEAGTGIITETVGSYTDESGNKVREASVPSTKMLFLGVAKNNFTFHFASSSGLFKWTWTGDQNGLKVV